MVVCVQYYLEELETSDKASTAINQYCFTILLFLFFHYTTCHEQIASKIYTPEKNEHGIEVGENPIKRLQLTEFT